MKKKVKENRRSKNKYAALQPRLNLKSRSDLLDYDYINKLSPEEKLWLANFTEEYVNASLPKFKKNKLHKTAKLKKACYDANNARNRDAYTKSKAGNTLKHLEDMKNNIVDTNTEDRLISAIDNNKKLSEVEAFINYERNWRPRKIK